MEIKSIGSCNFCGNKFSSNVISRHLKSCKKREELYSNESKEERTLLIKAWNDPFWVYFEIKETSTLRDVDNFLRDLWLECCGHLSMFTINGTNFASDPDQDYHDNDMNVQLKKIFEINLSFTHEYDFGTTTQLNLKCISEREGELKEKISILARNDLPEILCEYCTKIAKEICTECSWEGKGFLCEKCAKNHTCDEEMFLPIVNSPRMGMCGYTGED